MEKLRSRKDGKLRQKINPLMSNQTFDIAKFKIRNLVLIPGFYLEPLILEFLFWVHD